jgi:hypothetical protein
MKYRRLEKFLIKFVASNFNELSWENIYYLYKFGEQIRGKSENVYILCDIKKFELQGKLGFRGFNGNEIVNYKSYNERYGNFLGYLMEKFM